MDTSHWVLAPTLGLGALFAWNAWPMWVWEGRLVQRGSLPSRRFLVRRGPESYRLPWQSWQKKWGLNVEDFDPDVERVRRRVLLSSRLIDVGIIATVACWALVAVR